ncbi:unnamed protein product [Mytilus edulis]|uniref:Uncharacterized protein n=1 Tax=Mytilus edulis TaxID=6550 RepID=A0A8S3TMN5_MYTED|nr:unnamed protein product [Mytilus edulis]
MSDTEKLHSSPDGSSAHLTGNKDLVDTFSLFKTYLDGKFDTLYKDLAVGNENFKFATKLKPEVSVKRIRSAECSAIMSIQEKKRPHPYRTAAATVSASPATMPNQHYVRKTTNSRPFGPADEGNHHLTTSVSTATSLVTGELSAPFSVQNQLSQGHQGNIVNDKYNIFSCGVWKSLPKPVDQDLSSLSYCLPEFCLCSKAENTERK